MVFDQSNEAHETQMLLKILTADYSFILEGA